MAHHGHSHGPDGKCGSSAASPESDFASLINGESQQANMQSLNYVRSMTAIAIGAAAGVLGLTSWRGVLFFALMNSLTSLFLLKKTGVNPKEFIPGSPSLVKFLLLDGLTAQGASFVLFWTLCFALVHIY